MPRAVLAPCARTDLLSATSWIAKDNRTAARGLRQAVLKAAERIDAHPEIGTLRPDLADPPIRFIPLTGFPYLVVYDPTQSPALILRVFHGARDLPTVLRSLR